LIISVFFLDAGEGKEEGKRKDSGRFQIMVLGVGNTSNRKGRNKMQHVWWAGVGLGEFLSHSA